MNLIVFDIDGTLTRSEYQHQLAYVNSMKAIGIKEIDQNWKRYTHHTDSYILKVNYEQNFITPFDLKNVPDFESNMTTIMEGLDQVKAISGASTFIDYLRNEKKYAITFATGSFRKPAILKLNQANLWFDERLLACSNEYYSREEIVRDAIEKAKDFYNVEEFEHVISIGDGIWDLKTARNLKLKFIGIGAKNKPDFEREKLEVFTLDWEDFDFEHAEDILLKEVDNRSYTEL